MKERGTEIPFSSDLVYNKRKGIYYCAACGMKLFDSKDKFDSSTGWPSFTEASNVELKDDFSHGTHRTEVVCKKCSSHLGHIFDELGGKKRFCINGCVLEFKEGK